MHGAMAATTFAFCGFGLTQVGSKPEINQKLAGIKARREKTANILEFGSSRAGCKLHKTDP